MRAFNRFYTRKIGVLQEHHLGSDFSLAEARVLFEIGHRENPTATEIARDLDLDQGYLSRILQRFERRRLLARTPSATDGRKSHVRMLPKGRAALAPLDARSSAQVATTLEAVPLERRKHLFDAMRTIEEVLGGAPRKADAIVLRDPAPGDLGWIVQRHGALYAQEQHWDARFEALVAQVVADFVTNFQAGRERCWIAESGGTNAGCVMLVAKSRTVAQLRLLLVEPDARGRGIGSRLVDECVRFARSAGYRRIELWTDAVLHSARRVYERAGFRLVAQERHEKFGRNQVGQTWELAL